MLMEFLSVKRPSRRASRGLAPSVQVQRLESRTLMAAAVTAFPVPESGTIGPMTLGSDGNLWYGRTVLTGGYVSYPGAGRVGRVTPSGDVSEFQLPSDSHPVSDLVLGTDGNLWFTATTNDNGGNPSASFVDKVTPGGVISTYPLPGDFLFPGTPAVGTDGNIWFTGSVKEADGLPSTTTGRVARVTPSGTISEFVIPGLGTPSSTLTPGSDGNLWFTEQIWGSNQQMTAGFIGSVSPSGIVSEFPLPPRDFASISTLTSGSDGNLWFIETLDVRPAGQPFSQIGRVTPAGLITEYALPSPGGVASDLTLGPDGDLWFIQTQGLHYSPQSSQISRVTPSGTITEYPLPDLEIADNLTVGSDHNLWFTVATNAGGSPQIGRVTNSGIITEFPSPDSANNLTLGPDGDLWFVTNASEGLKPPFRFDVGRVAPTGEISTSFVVNDSPVTDAVNSAFNTPLAIGSDGNLWFGVTMNRNTSPTLSLSPIGLALNRVNVAAFPVPQPLSPIITDLTRSGVHAQPTQLDLAFSAPLDPASATNLHNYVIVISNARGRVHSRPLRIRGATYDAATHTVTLTMRHRLPIHGYYLVTARGTLAGTTGALLNGSGQPGTNYQALLHHYAPVKPMAARRRASHS